MRIRDVSWKLKAEIQPDVSTRLHTEAGLECRKARKPLTSNWPLFSPLLLQFPRLSYISFYRKHGH